MRGPLMLSCLLVMLSELRILTCVTYCNHDNHIPTMRKIGLLSALIIPSFLCTSTALLAIDALSPVERFLGNDYDPEEYSDLDINQQKRFAPTSPGDSDLGEQLILKRYDQREPFRVDLSTQVFWTNNTSSTNRGKDDGFIWQTRLDASWKPRIVNNLFFDVGVSEDIYEYDSPSFLDFERTDAHLGLIKICPDFFDIVLFARYEYARVTSGSYRDSIYHAHTIRTGGQKVFLSTPKHTAYLALGAATDLSVSPRELERNEYSAHLGYSYQITDRLKAVLYCNFTYYDYDTDGRNDENHVLGAELYWQLSHSTRLQASFTYVENNSNLAQGFADYDSLQGGLGIGFTTSF